MTKCRLCGDTKKIIKFLNGQREFGGDASTSYEIPCPRCVAQESSPASKFVKEIQAAGIKNIVYSNTWLEDKLLEACGILLQRGTE